jgi:hypothetical protein
MISKIHFCDYAPLFGPPFVSDERLLAEYFNKYPQNIIEDKTYVLRGNKGVEVRVRIIVRPKVVFTKTETPVPASNPDIDDYQEVLARFDGWHEQLIENAIRMADIQPAGNGAAVITTPQFDIYYEPRILWEEMSKYR